MWTDAGQTAQDARPPDLAVGAYIFHRGSATLTCRSGSVVPLGRRARALLSVLADHAGQDVSAAQLLDRVWPGQIVDPANVAVQVSGLRAAIGDSDGSVILTVHGRGYRLASPALTTTPGDIPHTLLALSGRETELANAVRRLRRDRLLVITGLSGTGKTRLACSAARQLADDFPAGQWLVPLSGLALTDAEALAIRINSRLGVSGGTQGDPVATLIDAVGQRACLLLLDGVELLGEGALALVPRLLEACPQAAVLVTSHLAHRRLRAFCVRLSPLPVPAAEAPAAATSLFLETAAAAGLDFQGDETAAPAIASICRDLGGLPLGVELAARAAGLLGLAATVEACRDPVRALPGLRRPGPVRHQSVGAAMGWSLGLLTPEERSALAALSALPGEFTTREAGLALARVGCGGGWLGRLHGKSMLERDGDRLALNPLVRACARSAA